MTAPRERPVGVPRAHLPDRLARCIEVDDFFFLAANALVLLLPAALWLAPVPLVRADARERYDEPRHAWFAVAIAVLVPFAGPLLYFLYRPAETREERRERRLSIRMLEATLDGERCLVCRTPVEPGFLCCPVCAVDLKRACPGCREPLELSWSVCPYCAAQVSEPVAGLRAVG